MKQQAVRIEDQLKTRFKWGIVTGIGISFIVMWIALELAQYIYV